MTEKTMGIKDFELADVDGGFQPMQDRDMLHNVDHPNNAANQDPSAPGIVPAFDPKSDTVTLKPGV